MKPSNSGEASKLGKHYRTQTHTMWWLPGRRANLDLQMMRIFLKKKASPAASILFRLAGGGHKYL